jgi:hypothetical protein
MSQENVEIVRRVSDSYNRRDVGAMLDELHPEIEWHPWLQLQFGGGATVYRGHQGVRKGIRELEEAFLRSRQSKQRSGTLASESSPSVTTGDAARRAAQ